MSVTISTISGVKSHSAENSAGKLLILQILSFVLTGCWGTSKPSSTATGNQSQVRPKYKGQ